MADVSLDIPELQILQNYPADGGGFYWHHRILIRKLKGGKWIAATPDLEIIKVNLNRSDYPVIERRAFFPADIAHEIYAFDPVGRAELEKLRRLGKMEGALFDEDVPEEVLSLSWIVSDPASELFGRTVTDAEMAAAVNIGPEGVVQLEDTIEHVSNIPTLGLKNRKRKGVAL